MLVRTLLLQYARYNQWAHKRLLDLINSLSTDQHHAVVASSFNSLYKTVLHVWGAESLWLMRMKKENTKRLGDPFEGSMENLSKGLEAIDQLWVEWYTGKEDVQLTEKLHYTNMAGQPFVESYDILLTHIFNHSTYHNGQLVTMLRALAIDKIPSTDFVAWTRLVQ
jgi:uncharacterized damage-inducible protein DinB